MFTQRWTVESLSTSVLVLERLLPWNKLYASISLYFLFPFLSALCLLISGVLLSVTRKSISAHHLVSVPKMHQKKRNKERAGLSEELWLGIQRCICCRSAFDCDLEKKRRDTCSEFHLILQLSWTLLCSPYIYIYINSRLQWNNNQMVQLCHTSDVNWQCFKITVLKEFCEMPFISAPLFFYVFLIPSICSNITQGEVGRKITKRRTEACFHC